jgi:carboxyl-terminal processing protease
LVLALLLAPVCWFVPQRAPAAVDEPIKVLLAEAQRLEKRGEWGEAADKYEKVLQLDRTQAEVRSKFQHCLRRYFQGVRLRDASYRKEVLTLKCSQALHLYEIVLVNLLNNSLDKDKVSAALLFRRGLEEFRYALASPDFCADHLMKGGRPEDTKGFRSKLQDEFGGETTMDCRQAVGKVYEVVSQTAHRYPDVNPTTIVMEFLCGACHAMDEYTVYLTPRQLRELCDTLKGKYVGVGLRLKVEDNKVVIAEILPDSPAAEVMPALAVNDQVVAVGKQQQPTASMTADAVMELLEGEDGTTVDLVISSPKVGYRFVTMRRRPLFVPSVTAEVNKDGKEGIGYLKIHCFQESTLDEFEAKLNGLIKAGSKALILDLRGNPGGLLDVSIEVARRFLSSGIIVSTQHYDPKLSAVFESSNPGAVTMPLAVLVDGDTASAAEVLAGALKENKRAKVIGQTTYGKGCSQGLLKLPAEGALRTPAVTMPNAGPTGGIRITIARFFSPTGQPYSGRGVEPDLPADTDHQMSAALQELYGQLQMMMQ